MKINMNFKITAQDECCSPLISERPSRNGITEYEIKLSYSKKTIPSPVTVEFSIPAVDMYSVWSPQIRTNRRIRANWSKAVNSSRLAEWMPVYSILSITDENKITVALSDAVTPTSIASGVSEETGEIDFKITLFTTPISAIEDYKVILRIDQRKEVAYYDAIYSVVEWWEKNCGYIPAPVPDGARQPVNSLWYSYHQELDPDDIVRECALTKPLGMDTVIIDDGWQTDDNGRGYAYCGDWEVSSSKIPDMRQFVERIHQTGTKVMVWFSVPFIGVHAKNYERFKDMLLFGTGNDKDYFSLDPRYKEVREFLISVYENAVKEWNIDGVKLDFIDSFFLCGKSLEEDERRDYRSLEDAIDALMMEVKERLTLLNPEILIEFRQSYVGPAIRKYGNMLRVGDCPLDPLSLRNDVINLRLTSGKTAVHSDMLMWNYSATATEAGLQLASVMYSVPQISVKIQKSNAEQIETLRYYLKFWKENREILLDGKLTASRPDSSYSYACAKKDGTSIVTLYTTTVVDCALDAKTVVINATNQQSVVVKNATNKCFKTVNCRGEELEKGKISSNLTEILLPVAGMLFIE